MIFFDFFGKTPESAETDWLKVYTRDFRDFMKKSHLDFWKQASFRDGIFIGYTIRPNPGGIWLYVYIQPNFIAAALRVMDEKNFDVLKQQEAEITPYFRDASAPLEFNRTLKYIGITRYDIDPTDVSDRAEQFYFLRHTLETLDLALCERVAVLD